MAKNGRYEAGKRAAEFEHVKAALVTIGQKLDASLDWQRSVDVRLATCEVRGEALEASQAAQDGRIDRLGLTDKAIGALALAGAAVATALGWNR